jgi:nucleoside-diphosphate-sugar epimerase
MVLGASGFIGRWVVKALDDAGARTTGVTRNAAALERLARSMSMSARVIEEDLSSPRAVAALLERERPAVVFNLAGYGVDSAERDAALAGRLNADLPATLASLLGEEGTVPGWTGLRLVHVGSALEYGTAAGDLDEATPPTPTTLYGQTKLAGTEAVAREAGHRGLAAVTARLFTVYGPGEHRGRLLPSLLELARSGGTLPLTAGNQRRDFTYVEDVAAGLVRLALASPQPGERVNLATGKLTAVKEFALLAAQELLIPEGALAFGRLPTRTEEMQHDPVAIRRLEQLVRWHPLTDIPRGVRLTAGHESRIRERESREQTS